MTRVYFLGGEDVAKRDSKEINRRAFVDAGGNPTVFVFPWTARSVVRTDEYQKVLVDYFTDLGASAVEFAQYSSSCREIAERAACSDLIYLPGGLTRVLVDRIRNKNVDEILRDYSGIIVGRSAGALALCRECILTINKDNPMIMIAAGIGLVDFRMKVHYNPSKDDELRRLSIDGKIYGIPERSALICNNGELSSIGDVYSFENGEKTRAA